MSYRAPVPVKQCLILVGGKGTRLGDLTKGTPKPLLEISPGLRFLDVVIRNISRQGFTDIILLAGYLGERVSEIYDGQTVLGAKVRVFIETEPLGTGGAIATVADHLDEWFVLMNGDSLFDINFRDFSAAPPTTAIGRLALRAVDDASRYGSVEFVGERITAFREKHESMGGSGYINGGIYLLSRDVLAYIDGETSIERDVFPQIVAEGRLTAKLYQGYFLDMGLTDTFAQAQREIPHFLDRPCLFLDRDGVINEDKGYTHRPEDLKFINGAPEAIKFANDNGFFVIVVTNQSGVARGLYSLCEVDKFHQEINRRLAATGAYIDDFYNCPYHEDGIVPEYAVANHPDRKPNPGMILRAKRDWNIIDAQSFMVGDKPSDIEAAVAAGIKGVLFTGIDLQGLINNQIKIRLAQKM
ncbi:HAD-IIIA family hydrolase [Asticcacaulis machinosus]|uniref:D,D-heptose 1,7-bisphosphate phosphatase n=1 Tax=Asticcacaulis machinosus TaxID=2984211 RepID=A0ABT5HJY5_9CAUL|nr:HAD-IIIA family hydrolase [Asticcacaulis machinosus]MDC7676497.1 HAD-IIIA family hydrolase [Asticcacaulis machinosus]